jgi:hypothetical protein
MVGTFTTFFSSNGEVAETYMRAVVRTRGKVDDLEAIRSIICGTRRDPILVFFNFYLRYVRLARCGILFCGDGWECQNRERHLVHLSGCNIRSSPFSCVRSGREQGSHPDPARYPTGSTPVNVTGCTHITYICMYVGTRQYMNS